MRTCLAFLHASRLIHQRRIGNSAPLALAGLASFTAAAWACPSASSSLSSCEASASSSSSQLAMSTSSSQRPGVVDLTDITGYLNAEDSSALDAELISIPGFSLEQLMELAGLAVAEAVHAVVPPLDPPIDGKARKHILLVCGPGNNGGDGLVAARHLVLFGYDCTVVYPKQSKKQHFLNLVKQMEDVGVEILEEMPPDAKDGKYAAIVDAIFGFSFKGEGGIREPFGSIIKDMVASQGKGEGNGTAIISVDVPSGWNVDGGDLTGTGFMPDVLVSLTSPKLSSKKFVGRHFVGGRFLPPAIASKYGVKMPPYPNVAQVMEVTTAMAAKRTTSPKEHADLSWEQEYAQYLAEKEAKESDAGKKEQIVGSSGGDEDTTEEWAVQYAAYCAEKEKEIGEADERKRREKESM